MLLFGGALGLAIALAMLAVRARCWAAVKPLGMISIVMLGLISAAAVLFLMKAGSKGGDSVIAAMTGLVFLVLGLALILGSMVLIGGMQAAAFKLPMWPSALSVIPEVIALGLVVTAYHSQVAVPAQRAITEEWWQRELAHRNRGKVKGEEIPAQYRGITVEMLNMRGAQQQELAKRGISVPSLVPPEVEKAIRNAEARAMEPGPLPDRTKQEQIVEDEKAFRTGAIAGWLIGALACPWIVRKRVLPPWHQPTA